MIVDCHMHVNWLGHNVHTLVKHLDDLGVDKTWLLTWELVNGLSYPGYVHLSEGRGLGRMRSLSRPVRSVLRAGTRSDPTPSASSGTAIKKGLKGFWRVQGAPVPR